MVPFLKRFITWFSHDCKRNSLEFLIYLKNNQSLMFGDHWKNAENCSNILCAILSADGFFCLVYFRKPVWTYLQRET